MIEKIHHVGLAVKSIEAAAAFFQEIFGAELNPGYDATTRDFHSRFVTASPYGNFDLLEPSEPDGLIGRFLQSRGEVIHHVSVKVDNVERMLDVLDAKGVQIVGGRRPAPVRSAFIHPKSAFGVLIELTEGVRGID